MRDGTMCVLCGSPPPYLGARQADTACANSPAWLAAAWRGVCVLATAATNVVEATPHEDAESREAVFEEGNGLQTFAQPR